MWLMQAETHAYTLIKVLFFVNFIRLYTVLQNARMWEMFQKMESVWWRSG